MDDNELMTHIKDLTSDSMTVFILKPIPMEKQVEYISYTAHSSNSFIKEKDGKTELSGLGSMYARMALDNMTMVARFYVGNKERIESFLNKYNDEYERITRVYELVRERRHQAKGWHDHAVLIKQEFDIDDQRNRLFEIMYRATFGKDAPRIDRKFFEQLKRFEQNG